MSAPPSGDTPRLLIAGCGDLGLRLARRLDGWEVTGLRRNTEYLPPEIRRVRADLSDPASLESVAGRFDAVVYTATPDAHGPAGYRRAYVDGLAHLLEAVETPRLVFVSSTAVYGQDSGEWVDEASETRPAGFNGEVLLEAEALARARGGVVVRFSGIYGPGREFLIRKVRAGPVPCRRDPPVWTNRIHSEDCAGVLAHLVGVQAPEAVYCASDREPATRWDVLAWLAGRLGAPGPVEADEPGGQGKRVSAARLFQSGFALQYPDFRAGYESVLNEAQ